MRRVVAAALLLSACGIPAEVHTQTVRDLEKCQQDLTFARTDLATATGRLEDERSRRNKDDDKPVTTIDPALARKDLDEVKRAREAATKRRAQEKRVAEDLKDVPGLAIAPKQGRMTIGIPEQPLFEPGKAELKSDARPMLAKVASALKDAADRDFLVSARTDAQPVPRGAKFKSNWELSTARAVALVQFLQNEGVDPRHLGALGRSEFGGASGGVDIIILPAPDETPELAQ